MTRTLDASTEAQIQRLRAQRLEKEAAEREEREAAERRTEIHRQGLAARGRADGEEMAKTATVEQFRIAERWRREEVRRSAPGYTGGDRQYTFMTRQIAACEQLAEVGEVPDLYEKLKAAGSSRHPIAALNDDRAREYATALLNALADHWERIGDDVMSDG